MRVGGPAQRLSHVGVQGWGALAETASWEDVSWRTLSREAAWCLEEGTERGQLLSLPDGNAGRRGPEEPSERRAEPTPSFLCAR